MPFNQGLSMCVLSESVASRSWFNSQRRACQSEERISQVSVNLRNSITNHILSDIIPYCSNYGEPSGQRALKQSIPCIIATNCRVGEEESIG